MLADAQVITSGSKTLPVPEPDLTPKEIIARARSFRDRLRAEQDATEARTYYSPELHEEFLKAGFYRILQPRMFGGYEFSFSTFFRTIIEIARGCPGTGWCLCLGAGHVITLASLFSEEAQALAFGEDGNFIAPSRPVPTGTAIPTENGWVVNGRWDYCSGSPYSTHILNLVMTPIGEDQMPRMGMALVPRDQVTIIEDWGDVIGLRGSGSHTTMVENAEVPHGFVSVANMITMDPKDAVGYKIHGNPMYAGRLGAFAGLEITACAIGIARAALDEYAEMCGSKITMFPPQTLRSENSQYQQWFGQAQTMVDCAEAALLRVCDLYHEFCEESASGGDPFTLGDDVRMMSMVAEAGELAIQAMDILIRTGGTSGLKNGTRMQRYWRDMSTFRSHLASSMRESGYMRSGAAYMLGDDAANPFAGPLSTK